MDVLKLSTLILAVLKAISLTTTGAVPISVEYTGGPILPTEYGSTSESAPQPTPGGEETQTPEPSAVGTPDPFRVAQLLHVESTSVEKIAISGH